MVKTATEQRPLLGVAVFFLVSFGLAWAGWITLRLTIGLDHMFDSFRLMWFVAAPSIGGFAAAFAENGWNGLRGFGRRVFNLRFSVWVWGLALLLPLLAGALTFAGHLGDFLHGGLPKLAPLLGAVTFMNFFTGPLAEEFGWRGYLLNRFARRMRPWLAGLVIGPIWAAWHIPLFYDNVFAHWQSAAGFVVWMTAWSIILALIVARARGSVLPSILGHWTINCQTAFFAALLPVLPHDHLPGGTAFTVASAVAAAALAVAWRNQRWQPPA